MRLDPNMYRRALDGLKPQLLKDTRSAEWRITEASASGHVPILAVTLYALRSDVLGPMPELTALATRLIAFYRYQGVLPWADLPNPAPEEA